MPLKINKQSDSVWNFEGQMTIQTVSENWEALSTGRPEQGVWILNFDRITVLDSAGLSFLLDCLRHTEDRGMKLQLNVLPNSVKQLIKVQGLWPLLHPHMRLS